MGATAYGYWPPVSLFDGALGYKNLVYSCSDVDGYR